MAARSEEYIKQILQKLCSERDIYNWKFYQETFETIAQNYFGIIIPVVLTGERDEKEVRFNLVLKLAPTDKRFRTSGAITVMFAREIYAYNVVLKIYQEIQSSFPAESQYIIPECYFVQKEYSHEAIVMQNMVEEGYKPYTCAMFLDLDHITISLKTLAKLHALSFILEHKNPDLYAEISKTCIPLTQRSSKRYIDVMVERIDRAMHAFRDEDYIQMLQTLKNKCTLIFDSVGSEEYAFSVRKTCLCHGDIWKENVLFKYENDKPVSACLIDYQSARICSPAFDAFYLIISSTTTELRRTNYESLLDIYYQAFDDTMKEGGLVAQRVYSREMFDYDLKIAGPAALITANCAMWLSNGLQEEGWVRSKVVWTTQAEKDRAYNKYKEIMRGMMEDCFDYGYL